MIEKFFSWIVKNPKKIFIIYVVVIVASAICYPFIGVNYAMSDYLPEGSGSTVALSLMKQEFTGSIPNCRVMVKDISVVKALQIKEALSETEGVDSVTWLDDSVSVEKPLATIDSDLIDKYYKDGNAIFSVSGDKDNCVETLENIRAAITSCGVDAYASGGQVAISGDLASMAIATTSTEKEIPIIAVIGIAFAIVVLFFVTNSWVEPFMVIIGLGVAVIINAGTNIIFGTISFVTNASGSILQMAVSLDYSVFLIHRFEECKKEEGITTEDAMATALNKSLSSIASSGLTTVIGFVALIFMKYLIGRDLGLALAKGIFISLVVVFTFMPAFIIAMEPYMIRTKHKTLMPDFTGFAKFARKASIPCVIIFIILLVPSFLAANANEYYFGSSQIFGEGTDYGKDRAAIEEIYGYSDTYVLIVPRGNSAREQQISDELNAIPRVTSVLSYADSVGTVVPEEYLQQLKPGTLELLSSDDYTRFVISLNTPPEGDVTFNLVSEIRALGEKLYPGEWYLAGEGVSVTDLRDAISSDILKVNLIAVGAIFLILLISFKSVSLPVILVLTIETAVWLNTGLPYFQDNKVFFCAYLIISSIQLGATVDYAILFTDRYMEFRNYLTKDEASLEIVRMCSPSILVSGMVLMVMGFLMYFISTHGIIAQLGYFLGVGALFSMIMVIFVLPGLLRFLDGIIKKTTKDTDWYAAQKEG